MPYGDTELILKLRYLFYRSFGPQPQASYLTFHGFKVMLAEKQREAERQARFASLGVSAHDITALADILFQTLEANGVFNDSGCNSHDIMDIARQRLGFDKTVIESAIENLCFREITEFASCDIPKFVHIRETVEWWRLQKLLPDILTVQHLGHEWTDSPQ